MPLVVQTTSLWPSSRFEGCKPVLQVTFTFSRGCTYLDARGEQHLPPVADGIQLLKLFISEILSASLSCSLVLFSCNSSTWHHSSCRTEGHLPWSQKETPSVPWSLGLQSLHPSFATLCQSLYLGRDSLPGKPLCGVLTPCLRLLQQKNRLESLFFDPFSIKCSSCALGAALLYISYLRLLGPLQLGAANKSSWSCSLKQLEQLSYLVFAW